MTQIASLLDINDCFPIEHFSGVHVTHKIGEGSIIKVYYKKLNLLLPVIPG
jgi:hypothetical protein